MSTRTQQESFSVRVKVALASRGMTVTGLARKIGYERNSVSIAIHTARMPGVKRKIRKALVLA